MTRKKATSMRKMSLPAAAAALVLAAGSGARAQSIDYGSLEQMFGEPVTTSATGSPQRSTEVPADMTIITADDIRRSGATDLPTLISRAAGVDILPFAAGNAELGIRGYDQSRSPRLLVLINGRQVYLDHFGYTDWQTLPVQIGEIRQIEIVRGPNSALFGFNAVSGVINIITYNPRYDAANQGEVSAGGNGYSSASLVSTFRFGDKVSVRLSGGGDHQDEWRNTNPAITAAQLVDPWTARAGLDAVAVLGPSTDLRIEGGWSNSGQTEMLSSYSYVATRARNVSVKATLSSDTPFGAIQAQIYQNSLDSKAPPLHYTNEITVANVQDLIKVGGAHTLRFGLEYRDNSVNTTPVEGGLVGYRVWSPSAMWNWQANPKLSLTAAARYDSLRLRRTGVFPAGVYIHDNAAWDRSLSEVSANLGAVYAPTGVDTLRLTWARGLQLPTLVELGSRQVLPATAPPVGTATLGNPALKPATVTSVELAYDRAIPSLGARVGLKVFHQLTTDVKSGVSKFQIDVPATATTYPVITYRNIGDSVMNGFEASGSGKFGSGFRWSADATYTDIKDKPIAGYSPVLRLVAYGATSPKWRVNAALGWSDSHWSADGYLRYVSDFNSYTSVQTLEPVAAYVSLGGRIAYRAPGGVTLAVSGQNLTDDRQAQAKTTGLQAERRVIFTLTKTW